MLIFSHFLKLCLVDSLNKRINFLNEVIDKLHLENIIRLLKQYKNYNIVITTRRMNNIHIYSLENYGTIIARNYPSPIAFVITEKNMTSSFWEYLTYTFATHSKKEKVIAFLEKYIKNL